MNRYAALFAVSVVCTAIGCDQQTSTTSAPSTPATAPAGSQGGGQAGDSHAGEKHDLGTRQAGGYSLKATQIGEVEPGGETVFEIVPSGGAAKPTAMRVWVGTETAEGSTKARAEAGDADYHAHVEIPAKLPPGSKLWVELETASGRPKASFDIGQHDHDHGK